MKPICLIRGAVCLLLLLGSTSLPVDARPLLPGEAVQEKDTAPYAGFAWRVDAVNEDARTLPKNFRTSDDPFREANVKKFPAADPAFIPSRKGLATLRISGSAAFSKSSLAAIKDVLRKHTAGPIYIVDLRQESHGFLNGYGVSWYGLRDWGNLGKSRHAALQEETRRLKKTIGTIQYLAKFSQKKLPDGGWVFPITEALTEEELTRENGLGYVRITATDHVWPAPSCIDDFIRFYRRLPKDSWLHFHCAAGVGRTTAFMAMTDMMRNPDVPLKDILYRQHLLGGYFYAAPTSQTGNVSWKIPYQQEKVDMLKVFHDYVAENHASNYQTSWSQWLRKVHP